MNEDRAKDAMAGSIAITTMGPEDTDLGTEPSPPQLQSMGAT